MRPLRIAIVTPMIVRNDGQGRVNYEIAMRAAEYGHEVTVVTTRVDPDVKRRERIQVVKWDIGGLPTSLIRTQVAAFLSDRWLQEHRDEFDIVHVCGSFALAASDVNAAHFVHDAWLRSPFHTSRIRKGLFAFYHRHLTRLHKSQEVVAFRRATIVVAVSKQVRDEIVAIGIDPSKIRIIPNGVDVEEFSPGPSVRSELGLPPDKVLVLFAGDMRIPRKNFEGVLRAVQLLPDVHVVALGSLSRNPYPALAHELGIAGRIHFLGFRRDVAQIMRSVDAFVFPSRYETFGLVILEALASGLPVITAATVGGAELVAEAGGIVLDDSERIDLLADAIARVSQRRGDASGLAARARETAMRYSWATMATEYLQLYEELAARKNAPAGLREQGKPYARAL